MSAQTNQQDTGSPYGIALESAIADLERTLAQIRDLRKAMAVAQARANDVRALIDQLGRYLPSHEFARYQQRLYALQSPADLGRGTTTTYDNVVELFARCPPRHWSASEVHKELAAKGIPSDPNQIHNVFQYLARKGRLRRVSRGRYEVRGYGVGIDGDPLVGYE